MADLLATRVQGQSHLCFSLPRADLRPSFQEPFVSGKHYDFFLVLGYILVAELVILGSVVGAWLSNACPQIQAIKEAYRWQHVLFYFGITALTAPFVFPLLLPRMVTAWKQESAVILAENEYWNGVRHEFKPLSLEPLHSGNVDAELREHFEHHSKVLETLGYEHLGEVWIKDSEPQWSKGSFWLSPDRTLLAEIMRVFDVNGLEICSFLDDGSIVSSANCKPSPLFSKMQKYDFHVFCHAELEMDELVVEQMDSVKEISERTGQPVREMDSESWRGYLRYEVARFAEVAHEIDGKTDVPDEIIFPEATTIQKETLNVSVSV